MTSHDDTSLGAGPNRGIRRWMPSILKRGTTNVRYVTNVVVARQHTVAILTRWGWLHDAIEVVVDGHTQFHGRGAGYISLVRGTQSRALAIDGEAVTLRWRWSAWGDPLFIELVWDGVTIAHYTRGGIPHTNTASVPAKAFLPISFDALTSVEREVDVSSDVFPLDNRHGTETMTVVQELSRTISADFSCETSHLMHGGMSANVAQLIQGEVGLDVSRKLNIALGQAITSKNTFRFSVAPRTGVVYTVRWKARVREGTYLVAALGKNLSVDYSLQSSLTYSIQSATIDESTC